MGAEPLRQTHQGTLYKRDRDRLAKIRFWLVRSPMRFRHWPDYLICGSSWRLQVGLVEPDSAGDRLLAAPAEFWNDNAVHLPQMIATAWLGLASWQELEVPPSTPQLPTRPCRSCALPCCFCCRHSANPSGHRSTNWRVSFLRDGRRGIEYRSRIRPEVSSGGPRRSTPSRRSRQEPVGLAIGAPRALRAGNSATRRGLPSRPDTRGRGKR